MNESAAERDANAKAQRLLMARDITDLGRDLTDLSVKVDRVSAEVSELVALFKGAKAVVNSVKWVGGLGAGIAALWALVGPLFHWAGK